MNLNKTYLLLAGLLIGSARNASADIITNGDFSANASSFVQYNGYFGEAGNTGPKNPTTIPGWVVNTALNNSGNAVVTNGGVDGPGIPATSDTDFDPRGYSAAPPAGTGTDPDTYLFLQNPGNYIYQNLTLAPLTTYTVSYLESSRSGNSPTGEVSITDDGLLFLQTSQSEENTGTTDFQPYSFTFTTGTDVSDAEITLANTTPVVPNQDTTVDFTDVSIVQDVSLTPEPGTFALLGVGVLTLLLVGRRSLACTGLS
jgi:hypothetical protein